VVGLISEMGAESTRAPLTLIPAYAVKLLRMVIGPVTTKPFFLRSD
jgi:hypothetical protein